MIAQDALKLEAYVSLPIEDAARRGAVIVPWLQIMRINDYESSMTILYLLYFYIKNFNLPYNIEMIHQRDLTICSSCSGQEWLEER